MTNDSNIPPHGAASDTPVPNPEASTNFSPTELPGGAEMDGLLRTWHETNRTAAAQGRDRLLAALARERGAASETSSDVRAHAPAERADGALIPTHQRLPRPTDRWGRGRGGRDGARTPGPIGFGRYALLAAAMIALAVLIPNLVPTTGPRGGGGGASLFESAALASGTVLAPEGGLLEARDERGDVLGPCILKHTDVDAKISGRFARVSVTQKYRNPHKQKIEAVYTFPLPHDAAVDRLKMRIGDRVIVGQVRERDTAREMYEAARDQGRVASLLEQERPNIFTQSVANIEPGAEIEIEISYVQTIEQTRDDAVSSTGGAGSMGQGGGGGEFAFVFPMTVSPRYIPVDGRWGGDASDARVADASARTRSSRHGQTMSNSEVVVSRARERSSSAKEARGGSSTEAEALGLTFRKGLVLRAPATVERMSLVFGARSTSLPSPGELARALDDALPVLDPAELEHERSETLSPLLGEAKEWLAAYVVYPDGTDEFVQITDTGFGRVGGRAFYSAALRELAQPTQYVEHQPSADSISPGAPFAKPTPGVPDADRITPMPVRPPTRAGHEVSIRVHLDTGGPGIVGLSAGSHPIVRSDLRKREEGLASEATVTLMSDNALTGGVIPNSDFVLRWSQTGDTVQESVFTHTGVHGNFLGILLQPPARVTNPEAAVPRELVFVVDTSGSMRGKPLEAAKEVMERLLATARARDTFNIITFAGRTSILWDRPRPATAQNQADAMAWLQSQEGGGGTEMIKAIEAALRQDETVPRPDLVHGDEPPPDRAVRPLRLAVFLTDGEVGNDMAIIDAVRRHRETTRVFTFGVGTSVNRYLLAGMATAGGGASEFVQLQHNGEGVSASDLEAVIGRFASRATTPLLTDIRVEATPGLNLMDFEPAIGSIPDVFDHSPVMLLCRYPDIAEPVRGEVTVSGWTGQGAWRRRIAVVLPAAQRRDDDGMGAGDGDGVGVAAQQAAASRGGAVASGSGHDVLATLWARRRIESLMNSDLTSAQHGDIDPELRAKVVTLGETFSIMSAYTSFVAIDALRITVDGRPLLVHVPIELPAQTDWENYFGLDEASLAKGFDDAAGGENEKAWRDEARDKLIQLAIDGGGASVPNKGDPMAAGTGGAVQSAPGAPGEPTGGAGGGREAAPAKKRVAKDEQKEEVVAGAPLIRGGDGRDAGGTPQTGRGTSLAVTISPPSPVADKSKVAAPPPPPTPPPPAMEAAPSAAATAPMPAPVAGVSASPAYARPHGDEGVSRARVVGGAHGYVAAGQAGSGEFLANQWVADTRSMTEQALRSEFDQRLRRFAALRRGDDALSTEALSREDAPSLEMGALMLNDRSGAPPALPSQLLAAAEVIRGVETARRTGQVDEIDDGSAIAAVQRSQRLAPTQSESLLRRQGQSIAQQRVVQNYNRVAMSQAPVVSGDAAAPADAQQKIGQRQNQTQYGLPPSVPSQARAEIPQELAQIEQQARAEFGRYARLVNKLDPRLAPALDPAWREEYRSAMKARTEAGRSLDRQATAKSTPRDTASNAADHSLDDAALLPTFDVIDDPALVAVRLNTYASAHVDALRNAGLEVLSISRSDGVIIGRLRLADVERVASLDEVAFVQLTDVLEAE